MDWWWMGGCGEEGEISKKKGRAHAWGGIEKIMYYVRTAPGFAMVGFLIRRTRAQTLPSVLLARTCCVYRSCHMTRLNPRWGQLH